MACNSTACVLVGPDVDHFVLELPPHTASFGRFYPTVMREGTAYQVDRVVVQG